MCSILMSTTYMNAQTWNIGGNANAGIPAAGGQFGTNGNRLVIFETNGVERARMMNTSGFWGFNATAPNARVHINAAAGETGLRVQINAATKLLVDAGGGVSVGSASIPPANGLFVSGNAGFGTTAPSVKLHVVGGSDASPSGGGYIVTGSITGANVAIDENEIMARSNGSASALFFNNNGGNVIIDGTNTGSRVGIGTSSPVADIHLFHAFGSFTNGLRLENEGTSGLFWNFYTRSSGDLELSVGGSLRGTFNGTTGAYSAVSDRRLKKDIEKAPDLLDKIMQLQVSKYHMATSKPNEQKYFGLIAQDVEKIFPEVVYKSKADNAEDYYTMDYTAFGVLAIKAIQEQQKTINTLEDRIAKLERALSAVNSKNTINDLAGISLEQNQPNPFNHATVIRYKIPTGANAQINVYDASGAMAKVIRATESGQVQINAGELKSGTYTYALVVNGKQVASKKMVLLQ